MLQIFNNKDSKIILENTLPQKNIDMINEHINLCNCRNMTIDISKLNIIDACMVSTVCSTTHYLKYPDGKISWITNSDEVEEYTKPTNLGNSFFTKKIAYQ